MFIFLEYEVFFGGSNDQFMGLILVSFLVQNLKGHCNQKTIFSV